MKINKTLAAGIAATLAVTSLASVASATTARTFDMEKTTGYMVYDPVVNGIEAIDPGFFFDAFANDNKQIVRDFAITGDETEVNIDTNGDGQMTPLDFDYFIPFVITADDASLLDGIGDITVNITGKRVASDGATLETETQKAKLIYVGKAYNDGGTPYDGTSADTIAESTEDDTLIKNGYADATKGYAWVEAGANYILPIYTNGSPASNAFIPERFVQIDKIEFSIAAGSAQTFSTTSEELYNKVITASTSGNWDAAIAYCAAPSLDDLDSFDVNLDTGAIIAPWDCDFDIINTWVTGYTETALDGDKWSAAQIRVMLGDAYTDADQDKWDDGTVAYKLTSIVGNTKNGISEVRGTAQAIADLSDNDGTIDGIDEGHDGGHLFSAIKSLMAPGASVVFKANTSKFYTEDSPAMLLRTERYDSLYSFAGLEDGNDIMVRDEIWKLSDTKDYNSDGDVLAGSETISNNQTYTVEDYNKGTIPRKFAGLASQVADFFNSKYGEDPKSDAKIIFTFEAFTPAGSTSAWKNGGVPSTEVGLRNFLEAAKVKDFALFFNYNATTGSLQASASLDATSGSVEFDISDILKQLRGATIGVIQDIYYGLGNGIGYYDRDGLYLEGLYVKEVRLEYDESATASDTKGDEDKDAEVKGDDNKTEDDTNKGDDKEDDDTNVPTPVEEDDDEKDPTVVIEDDDTKEPAPSDNNGPAVVDNGGNKTPAADENPHTGVALAVIPAAIAGAAAVIFKKRK